MKQAAPYLAIGAIALLLSTLLFGDSHKGASRWIKVGLTMQPVEYFKFAFLLIARSSMCSRRAYQLWSGYDKTVIFMVVSAVIHSLVPA